MKNRLFLSLATFVLLLFWSFGFGIWNLPDSFAAFSDVPASHPYQASINYVQQQKIVGGYPDGTYQPDRILNRAEFIKIIIESRFDENTINTCINRGGFYDKRIFNDVEPGVWFEKYVCVGKAKGIIQGYADGTFRPIQTIIYAEAAKIVSESYGLKIGTGDPWFEPYLTRLKNLNATPPTLASIQELIQRGIKEMTRGEMADIIYRLRNIQDQVVSNDGSFSIQVPENALPSGVKTTDIRITKLSDAEKPVQEVNGAPMVFYRLEPDGIRFNQPVSFTIETDTVANTVPLVFLVSGNSFDVIPEPIIEIDQSRNKALLTANISHFSEIALGFSDHFQVSQVTLSPAGNQEAGNPFNAAVTVTTNTPPQFSLSQNAQTLTLLADWTLDSVFLEKIPGTLDPYFKETTRLRRRTGVNVYPISTQWNCSNTGTNNTQIEYQGRINFNYDLKGRTFSQSSYIRSESTPFTCKQGDPLAAQYEVWRQFAFELLNQIRQENGVAPMTMNELLNDIADVHARDMALNIGELSHQGSLGEESYVRIKEGKVINIDTNTYQFLPIPANIDRSGENIGKRNIHFFNDDALQAIMDQYDWFMSTPATGVTHRTTMLSTNIPFTQVGIGLYLDEQGDLWIVQNFISLL